MMDGYRRIEEALAGLDPDLTIVHESVPVRLGRVEMVGIGISAPFTRLAPRYRDLVLPAATVADRYGYRYGRPVFRARCRLSLTAADSVFHWPVELGETWGADILVGYDLLCRTALIRDVRSIAASSAIR